MITLKELAAHCGVSTACASKALNNAPDIGVETAERIRAAADALGYHPNAAARALKTRRSYNIGVLFEDDTHCGLTHEYFVEILNAVKNAAENAGYDVTFISKNLNGRSMSFLEHCRTRSCDGVVIACVDFTDPAVAELVGSEIPVVTIDYVFDGNSAVLSENAQGMRDLLQHVYDMGHRRIAFIHGEKTAVTQNRVASFYQFCAEKGIEVPPEYLVEARYHDSDLGREQTKALLKSRPRPTCILYPDDVSLLGGLAEIRGQGLRVPEDISIAGYDGISLSRLMQPQITTLRQNSEALGTRAAELLLKAIESPKTYIPEHIRITGTVQVGSTVGKPAKDTD